MLEQCKRKKVCLRLIVDRWYAQYAAVQKVEVAWRVCRKVRSRPVQVTAQKQGEETDFVFGSSIDWKPVQRAKLRCTVVCPRFQDMTAALFSGFLQANAVLSR